MMTRDMTKAQFDAALKRNNFKWGHFGFVKDLGSGLHIYAANAGSRRRDQLAYLIAVRRKYAERGGL